MLRKDSLQCLGILIVHDYKSIYGRRSFHRKVFPNACYSDRFVNVPMHSIVTSKLCHVTRALERQQFCRRSSVHFFLASRYTTHCTQYSAVMASRYFKGHNDRYNGVTIDSNEESCEIDAFAQRLEDSLQQWLKEKKRAAWFRVHLLHSGWVPILVKEGFKFHHAREEYVMLYRWLSTDEQCNIPPYAHTNLGVGAFVFNDKTNEVLVIKEKYSGNKPMWKLPGGFVEPGENLEDAVKREVLEETNIQTTFRCLITFRHGHGYAFDCSDIYMIAYLSPDTHEIQKCNREISECQWMKLPQLEEYSEHPDVHENNRQLAKKMLEFLQHKMGISVDYALHPITKKPISVFSISKMNITHTPSK